MKIARFEKNGRRGIGIVIGDQIIDVAGVQPELPSDMRSLIAGGTATLASLWEIASSNSPRQGLSEVRLLAPVERPAKYLAIGMNYAKHIAEAKREGISPPSHQYWFNKQTSCINDPYGEIVKPAVSDMVDYEVELGVVIGRTARRVPAEQALNHIFGYVVCNDVSVRDWQRHAPSFTMGKSFDTHGPIGPWIVTADEIANPHDLDLKCWVNGELRQSSNTSEMIANIFAQIAYLSTACTLEPGDIIGTGTPEGVGLGMHPPCWLKVGDIVRCEVENIGHIEHRIVAPSD